MNIIILYKPSHMAHDFCQSVMRCYEHNNTVQTFTYGTRFLSSCTDKLVFVTKTNKLLFLLILMPIVVIIIIIITMVIRDTDSDVC